MISDTPSCQFVCHFKGWIQGLTTEPQQKEAGPGDKVKVSEDASNKIQSLK